jgi:hypothetical protein
MAMIEPLPKSASWISKLPVKILTHILLLASTGDLQEVCQLAAEKNRPLLTFWCRAVGVICMAQDMPQ